MTKYLLALVLALAAAAPAPAQVSVQIGPGWRRPFRPRPFPTRFAFDPRFAAYPYYDPFFTGGFAFDPRFADSFAFDPFRFYGRRFPWWVYYRRWW